MLNDLTRICSLKDNVGKTATIGGWVYHSRPGGKVIFLVVRDGSGLCQCIIEKTAVPEELFRQLSHLGTESSLTLTGTVRADNRSVGGYELAVTDAKILCPTQDYPITPKPHGIDFLLKNRHLNLRSQRQWSIGKIRHTVVNSIRQFFNDNGFTLVDTPILTGIVGEEAGSLFNVDYFEMPAFLTQTGQLHLECAALSFGRVYCFGPTFRAEKSKTRRHLTEFWMVEPEVAFATLEDTMRLAEGMICFILERVLTKRKEQLEILERNTSILENISRPFPRISYDEAVGKLQKAGSEIKWGGDFGGGDETILSGQYSAPLMVHRYPSEIKAFYMQPDPDRPEVALCVDMLAPEGYGEIIGGGQRIHDCDLLMKRLEEHKLSVDPFQWYLDLRKYGTVPHAGFGMGIERAVTWICNLSHLREAIAFPRMLYRIYP